jgi:hypothetical protein
MTKQKYRIIVDDNFHFMDESESYNSGSFSTYEEAVAKCKTIIDDFLGDAVRPDDTPEGLYSTFVMYGETPHICGEKLGNFSATDYARQRCSDLTNASYGKKGAKAAFIIRPLQGETVEQFKARLKEQLK